VSLDNVPAFVLRLDAPIVTPRWGTILADIAYGGVFYAKADVEEVGLRIVPEHARELVEAVGETTVRPLPRRADPDHRKRLGLRAAGAADEPQRPLRDRLRPVGHRGPQVGEL
jgi:proline racemase